MNFFVLSNFLTIKMDLDIDTTILNPLLEGIKNSECKTIDEALEIAYVHFQRRSFYDLIGYVDFGEILGDGWDLLAAHLLKRTSKQVNSASVLDARMGKWKNCSIYDLTNMVNTDARDGLSAHDILAKEAARLFLIYCKDPYVTCLFESSSTGETKASRRIEMRFDANLNARLTNAFRTNDDSVQHP